jgi:hypothetical protein
MADEVCKRLSAGLSYTALTAPTHKKKKPTERERKGTHSFVRVVLGMHFGKWNREL